MVDKDQLSIFSISELKKFRAHILNASTKEELLESIDEIIKKKEENASKSLNSRYLVDWMTIDPRYKKLLHNNGIETEAELLAVKDLWSLQGMNCGAHEQISWAQTFFDMSQIEQIPKEERSLQNVAKVVVKSITEGNYNK